MPVLSIIIPTWKRDEIFAQTITAAIAAVKDIDAEIIVINDFSEKPIVIDNDKVTVVNNRGRGVTVARNYGARLAKAKLILFVDNDIVINKDNIIKTLALHEQYSHVLANSNWVYPDVILKRINDSSFGRILISWRLNSFKNRYEGFNGPWSESIFEGIYPFAAFYFSIEKEDYLATGGLNENIIVGGEEEGFANELKKLGIKYIVDPENIVLHNEIDRTFDYKEWLKRTALAYQQKDDRESIKKPFSFFKLIGFMEKPLYKILDSVPNKPSFDKTYARILSVLKNVIIHKQ